MMRTTRVLVTTVLAGVLILGLANLATAAKKAEEGQALFKEYCKSCHGPDSPDGEYTPMTLIQDQWQRFFDEKYVDTHGEVKDPNHGDKPVTEVITPDNLKLIKKFAIDHAADSEHPMTCG